MKKSAQNYQGGAHESPIKPNHTTSAQHGGSLGSLNKLELWTNVMKKSVQNIMNYYGGAHESSLKSNHMAWLMIGIADKIRNMCLSFMQFTEIFDKMI